MSAIEAVCLFSGVGGFELALHRNGVETKAMCEIDPHARAVLRRHFPDVPIFNDVREVTGDALRNLDGWAFQVFAPPSDHVNIAQVLHVWGRADGARIHPDFAWMGAI
jgi:site-specific DNA-cytosine methylase